MLVLAECEITFIFLIQIVLFRYDGLNELRPIVDETTCVRSPVKIFLPNLMSIDGCFENLAFYQLYVKFQIRHEGKTLRGLFFSHSSCIYCIEAKQPLKRWFDILRKNVLLSFRCYNQRWLCEPSDVKFTQVNTSFLVSCLGALAKGLIFVLFYTSQTFTRLKKQMQPQKLPLD